MVDDTISECSGKSPRIDVDSTSPAISSPTSCERRCDSTHIPYNKSVSDTDSTEGKVTPKSILKRKRKAAKNVSNIKTRRTTRMEKRAKGKTVKIILKDNEIKEFYKKRMITTDFDFNPRFDHPSQMKRKRDQKAASKIYEDWSLEKTDSILKQAPSREIF
jgi:hypothetical protein